MTHVDLWRQTREALWQKAQGIITAEEAIWQIERVVTEYQFQLEKEAKEIT